MHKTLVAGNVHNADAKTVKVEIRKPKVDRDPAFLLFRQTVGIHSRQAADQTRFAVVDVTGRAEDQMSSFRVGLWHGDL